MQFLLFLIKVCVKANIGSRFFVSNSIANHNTFNKVVSILSMKKILFLLCFPHFPLILLCFPLILQLLLQLYVKLHLHVVSL